MTIEELKSLWNAQDYVLDEWDDLGVDEIVAFAQQQALFVAAEQFAGTREYNWVCADGYSNAMDIAGELRVMAVQQALNVHKRERTLAFVGEHAYTSPYQKEETEDLIKQVNELREVLGMCWRLLPDGDYGDDARIVKRAMTRYKCWPEPK